MNSIRNGFIREILRGFFFSCSLIIQIANWIRRKKGLTIPSFTESPQGFPEQIERLEKLAKESGEKIFSAQTSGTRNVPKVIPYTASRMKLTQKTFLKSMMTLTYPYPGRKTFFVFSSIEDDSSLTSGMLTERAPNLIELLQAPYRFLTTPAGIKLRNDVGPLAARVAIIAITSPRYFYATNPSTLTNFLDEVKAHWPVIREGLKKCLIPELLELADGDALSRVENLSTLESPTLEDLAPELVAMISWDGGYVVPFVDRLKEQYPKIAHIPMYSMSTETIQTIPHLVQGKLHFLPTMEKVWPEFLKDQKIYAPHELIIGECYTLLVSDEWGLRRYDTQDVFLVKDMVDGLPDLRFKRRRNITASMTGEKLSEEQCVLLYRELEKRFKLDSVFLSMYGKMNENQGQYILNLIGPNPDIDLGLFAKTAQDMLSEINLEYASKVKSGRLLPLDVAVHSLADFAQLMGQKSKLESQFKVVPLYEKPVSSNK